MGTPTQVSPSGLVQPATPSVPASPATPEPPTQAITITPNQPAKRQRRISKAGLGREVERQMLENAPDVLSKKWAAVKKALDAGERWACELVARQFEGDKGPGGVNILSQTLNVTGASQDPSVRSLESIVRKLEVKDNLRVLPEPTPVKRVDLDVIDVGGE